MTKKKIVTKDSIIAEGDFSVKQLKKIPASIVDETVLLTIFKEQIRKMSFKYKSMAAHSVGGSTQDLISSLNIRALVAFKDWKQRIATDGSIDKRNALDIVKFISCRLRTHCIDLARYQRDRIEPAYQMFDYVNPEGKNNDALVDLDSDTEIWRAHLTDIQRKIVDIWKEGTFYNRKDPVKALAKEVSRRLSVKENIIMKELMNLPQL